MVAQPVWLEDDGEDFLLGVAAAVPAWQRDAACVEHPSVEWFPKGKHDGRAQAVCAACLVQSECLAFALDEGLDIGIWGGALAQERATLTKRGVTGDLIRRFGCHVDAGRELDLDLASFAKLDDVDGEYARALAELLEDDED